MRLEIPAPLIRSTIALVLATTSVKAANVTHFGADPSAAARETWRTAANNAYDADQNNQYGTAGYAMLATAVFTYTHSQFGVNPFTFNPSDPAITPYVLTPSYITAVNQMDSVWQWGAYYPDMQNPNNTASTFNSGLAGVNDTRTGSLVTLAFGANTPASIRLGLYTGEGTTDYTVRDITPNTGGSTATMTNIGDFRFGFFDLTGLKEGDQIQIYANRTGGNNNVQLSGYTLDVISKLPRLNADNSIPSTGLRHAAAPVSFPSVDAEPFSKLPASAIVLHEGWEMRESALSGMDGAGISRAEFKPAAWYATTVPTTALAVLVRHGVYPDPYIGLNNMKIPDASDALNQRYDLGKFSHLPDKSNPWSKPYWFRKTFTVPADYSGKFVWLNLDGINYRADVWLNGKQIAKAADTVGMFRRFKLDITGAVKPGATNALAIAIHPLDHPGDPQKEQLESLNGDFGANSGDGEILRNVTQYSSVGWDWVPAVRDRNMGIWQHVSIHPTGPVTVADPAAFPRVSIKPNETNADVKLRFYAANASDQKQRAELLIQIRNPGRTETVASLNHAVELEPHSRKEIILTPDDFPVLKLKNPALWWPAHHGAQPLYHLEVTATTAGKLSNSVASRFGVREVSSYLLPSGGRAFSVNGRPIRITGGHWISDFLLSWSAQRYRDEVRLLTEGNATLVRVNGCSIMPPEVFLDACDEYGLLVWQDLSRTSATGEGSDLRPKNCDPAVFMDNMTDFINRARGHSSILLWCGSNEVPAQDEIGQALQDHVMPALDDSRIFILSSERQPSWAKTPIATQSGGPWHMVRLPEYYALFDSAGFTSKNEIGLPSLPPINSLAKAIPDFNEPLEEFFPLNLAMSYHDAVGGGNGGMKNYCNIMYEDIGQPTSIAEMLRWGDLYNNQAYRTIFEASNRARPKNNLTTLWKSNAAWPSFMWQIFDWYLRPNAGYYTMKSALKPLHVQFSHPDKGVQVISTLTEDVPVKVIATAMTADGKPVGTRSWNTNIAADLSVPVGDLREILPDGPLYLIALDLLDASGKPLDRTVTWTQHQSKWQELLQIPPVDLDLRVVSARESGDEQIYDLAVTNPGPVPAVNVMVELTDGAFGNEILPSFWSNNALSLVPGETTSIQVKVRRSALPKNPCFVAEGLNVNPSCWKAETGQVIRTPLSVAKLALNPGNDQAELRFSTQPLKQSGSRITTGPVPLKIDGKLVRYLSVAASPDQELTGRIKLPPLAPGEHQIELGGSKIQHISPAGAVEK